MSILFLCSIQHDIFTVINYYYTIATFIIMANKKNMLKRKRSSKKVITKSLALRRSKNTR